MKDFHTDTLPLWELRLPISNAQWLEQARTLARQIAKKQGWVSVDCIRTYMAPPPDADPRIMGAVLRRSEFDVLKYVQSTRAVSHKRPIAVFVLKCQK
jgi:hypothetical protein